MAKFTNNYLTTIEDALIVYANQIYPELKAVNVEIGQGLTGGRCNRFFI